KRNFLIQTIITMSLVPEFINNPVIDSLIESSLESENTDLRLEWIPYEQITNIEPTQIGDICYAILKDESEVKGTVMIIMLLLLGSDEICTPAFVNEFASIYSLPT